MHAYFDIHINIKLNDLNCIKPFKNEFELKFIKNVYFREKMLLFYFGFFLLQVNGYFPLAELGFQSDYIDSMTHL